MQQRTNFETEYKKPFFSQTVFKLAELLQFQDGKIVNMDVVHNDKMKFVLMAPLFEILI